MQENYYATKVSVVWTEIACERTKNLATGFYLFKALVVVEQMSSRYRSAGKSLTDHE